MKFTLDRYASFFLIVAINGLFICKYLLRVASPSVVWGCLGLYVAFLALACLCFYKASNRLFCNAAQWGYLFLLVVSAIGLLSWIPVTSLRVDRWNVIESFFDALLKGQMPYAARSFNGNVPGPFPVYFVLMIPFYMIREIGYFTVVSIMVFFWVLQKTIRLARNRMAALLFVTASPLFAWEVITRSTIFGNAVLCLGFLWLLEGEKKALPCRRAVAYGLLTGLMAATRGITAIPILIYTSHRFLRPRLFQQFILINGVAGLTFLGTLMPFYIWDSAKFQISNPLTVQTGFLMRQELLLILLLSVIAGLISPGFRFCLATSGVILVFSVVRSHIGTALWASWSECLFGSACDISYYVFAIPFLAVSIWAEEGDARPDFPVPFDRTFQIS